MYWRLNTHHALFLTYAPASEHSTTPYIRAHKAATAGQFFDMDATRLQKNVLLGTTPDIRGSPVSRTPAAPKLRATYRAWPPHLNNAPAARETDYIERRALDAQPLPHLRSYASRVLPLFAGLQARCWTYARARHRLSSPSFSCTRIHSTISSTLKQGRRGVALRSGTHAELFLIFHVRVPHGHRRRWHRLNALPYR